MVPTLIAAVMKRRGATPHPAKYFKNTRRGVFSANWGKEQNENLPKSACARGHAEASLRHSRGGEENVYSQSWMMAHPYGTNCACQHYCHSQL